MYFMEKCFWFVERLNTTESNKFLQSTCLKGADADEDEDSCSRSTQKKSYAAISIFNFALLRQHQSQPLNRHRNGIVRLPIGFFCDHKSHHPLPLHERCCASWFSFCSINTNNHLLLPPPVLSSLPNVTHIEYRTRARAFQPMRSLRLKVQNSWISASAFGKVYSNPENISSEKDRNVYKWY